MGGFEEDLDLSTARAWSEFQARLADHVVAMEDDQVLVIEALSGVDEKGMDGSAPYVQFCAFGEDLVRCEVSSNEYLASESCLDPAGVESLIELGWSAPTCGRYDENPGSGSANFHLDEERSDGDRLAVMTVTALREVFGVQHPAFLAADGLGTEEPPVEPVLGPVVPEPDPTVDPRSYELLAVLPRDHEHLQRLVSNACAPLLGHAPEFDADGDIVVLDGENCAFVRAHDAALVEIYSLIALSIKDRARAAYEVLELNRAFKLPKFVLLEDAIVAFFLVPAQPFAPEHLRKLLGLMMSTLDSIDDDLPARVSGLRPRVPESPVDSEEVEDKPEEDDPPPHPAMVALRELEAESPGSVDPELAAGICEMDRELILELIRYNTTLEAFWRDERDAAIEGGDPDEQAASHDGEMLRAIRMQSLLRRALRVVIERRLGRQPGGTSYDEPRRRRTTQKNLPPRPKRRPEPEPADPTLDEVDPDAWN